eukprot:6491084-Amphidinium_carterae.1
MPALPLGLDRAHTADGQGQALQQHNPAPLTYKCVSCLTIYEAFEIVLDRSTKYLQSCVHMSAQSCLRGLSSNLATCHKSKTCEGWLLAALNE